MSEPWRAFNASSPVTGARLEEYRGSVIGGIAETQEVVD
jgi:hypothetical protein